MKKKVNGSVVEIKNLELFKLAYEGKLLNKRASSKVKDTIENKSELVKDLVNAYSAILDSLVFPLNMVETSIKYTMIAIVLKERVREKHGEIPMQVDNSICIEVEDGKILRLLAGTWAIESTPGTYHITTNINLEFFNGQPGYDEANTKDFYEVFMSEFMEACKNQDLVLKWELSRILDFGNVPSAAHLNKNRITDEENNRQYYLDVYCTGKRETRDNVLSFTRDSAGLPVMATEKKKIRVYNFEVYSKSLGNIDNKTEKASPNSCDGMGAIFDVLLSEGIEDEQLSNISYTGIVNDDILLFEVNKEIYMTTFKTYEKPQRLMSNVNIYAFDAGRVYVKRRKKLYSGVYEETIYSYELDTGKARLCKISFSQ
jgi:hypothetical protein